MYRYPPFTYPHLYSSTILTNLFVLVLPRNIHLDLPVRAATTYFLKANIPYTNTRPLFHHHNCFDVMVTVNRRLPEFSDRKIIFNF